MVGRTLDWLRAGGLYTQIGSNPKHPLFCGMATHWLSLLLGIASHSCACTQWVIQKKVRGRHVGRVGGVERGSWRWVSEQETLTTCMKLSKNKKKTEKERISMVMMDLGWRETQVPEDQWEGECEKDFWVVPVCGECMPAVCRVVSGGQPQADTGTAAHREAGLCSLT